MKGLGINAGLVAIFIESVFTSFIKLMFIPISILSPPLEYFKQALLKPLEVL